MLFLLYISEQSLSYYMLQTNHIYVWVFIPTGGAYVHNQTLSYGVKV